MRRRTTFSSVRNIPRKDTGISGVGQQIRTNGSAPAIRHAVVTLYKPFFERGVTESLIQNRHYQCQRLSHVRGFALIPSEGCHLLNRYATIVCFDPHSSRPLAGSQARLQSQNKFQGKVKNRLVKTNLFSLLLSPQPKDVLLTEHLHSRNNF